MSLARQFTLVAAREAQVHPDEVREPDEASLLSSSTELIKLQRVKFTCTLMRPVSSARPLAVLIPRVDLVATLETHVNLEVCELGEALLPSSSGN